MPGVDPVAVTCTAVGSDGCKRWTLTPSGTTVTGEDPNVKNQTTLLHIDSSGTVLATGGHYNVSFSITIDTLVPWKRDVLHPSRSAARDKSICG